MLPYLTIGPMVIPVYFFILSFVYTGAVYWTYKRALQCGFDVRNALDLGLAMMLGGFIGARALHVFYEAWDTYSQNWIRIFYLWEGGFVFYGGAIGALLCATLLIRSRRLLFMEWADFFAPIFAIGYGVGRLSCFFAGCCYGKVCDLPWAVKFPFDSALRHPTQLYAVFWELALGMFLLWYEKRERRGLGQVFAAWVFLHGLGRLLMERFRDDFRGEWIYGLSLSTWISLLVIIIGATLFWKRRNPPFPSP